MPQAIHSLSHCYISSSKLAASRLQPTLRLHVLYLSWFVRPARQRTGMAGMLTADSGDAACEIQTEKIVSWPTLFSNFKTL